MVIGQAFGALGLVGAVRILTAVLSPAEYGTFTLGLSVALLASQVVFGPLANAAQRFYSAAREDRQLVDFWVGLGSIGQAASLLGLLVGALAALAVHAVDARVDWVVGAAAVAFSIFSGWDTILDAAQNARRRRWVVAWHQITRSWLRPALAAVLVAALPSGGAGASLAGYAVASAIVLVSQICFAQGQVPEWLGDRPSSYTQRLLAYALPFGEFGVVTWLQLASDRWALEVAIGPSAVATYAVLIQLGAQPLVLLGTAAAQMFEPMVYARAGSGSDVRRVRSAIRLNGVVTTAGVLVVLGIVLLEWLAHGLIVSLLAAPEYRAMSAWLPVAGLSGGLFSLGQLLAMGSVVLGGSRVLLTPKIGCAVLGTLLNVVAAYSFGAGGVLVAGVVTAAVYVAWVLWVTIRGLRRLLI